MIQGSNPSRGKRSKSSPKHPDQACYSEGTGVLSEGSSGQAMKLTTHLKSQGYKPAELYIYSH